MAVDVCLEARNQGFTEIIVSLCGCSGLDTMLRGEALESGAWDTSMDMMVFW